MKHVSVDFSRDTGKMNAMHSVNNGPAGNRTTKLMSNYDTYAALKIPYARTHDAAFYAQYGGEYTVDVHCIFRNFDADENDPASYDFEMTDRYMNTILAAGTKPFYRLGTKIENHKQKGTAVEPPKDFHKWARICEHIIRHLNEGWANGHHMGIEYWEIWNEPDLTPSCWLGTVEQFVELFTVTLKHLKTCFPNLKIGGPAVSAVKPDFIRSLLNSCRDAGLMPDFFSFHRYAFDPYSYEEDTNGVRALLREYGWEGKAELILNEWNYVREWTGDDMAYSHQIKQHLKGASFCAAVMCVGQRAGLDQMMYYDARPTTWNGLFTPYFLQPTKTYHAFMAFSQLYQMGRCVQSSSDDKELHVVAARGESECGLMLTYYNDGETADGALHRVALSLAGYRAGATVEIRLLDDDHDLTLIRSEKLSTDNATLYLDVPLHTVYSIRLSE